MAHSTLTERQQQLYNFIVNHMTVHGSQPSYEEMMQHMCVSSPNAIQSLVSLLEKKEYVQRTGKARAMKILRVGVA